MYRRAWPRLGPWVMTTATARPVNVLATDAPRLRLYSVVPPDASELWPRLHVPCRTSVGLVSSTMPGRKAADSVQAPALPARSTDRTRSAYVWPAPNALVAARDPL